MAEILSIPRRVLHQEVAVRLRQRIVEGHLAPGAKLNERELSELLQVSRTPLREAIKMLAAEGLVELVPRRGAVVDGGQADRAQDAIGHRAGPRDLQEVAAAGMVVESHRDFPNPA